MNPKYMIENNDGFRNRTRILMNDLSLGVYLSMSHQIFTKIFLKKINNIMIYLNDEI